MAKKKQSTSPFKMRELRRAKQQPMHKDVYVLGEFDEEGEFIGFVQNQREPNQIRGYVGNRSGKSGRNIYRRRNPDKIIEALWIDTFRIARFYNKDGEKSISNITKLSQENLKKGHNNIR